MTAHGAALVAKLKRRFVTVNDEVYVADHVINLIRPRSAEDLISETDFERDERLPYWAELWPSSTILADFVLRAVARPARTIELGCGVGLVSIAATYAGHSVLATDYYEDALLFARANAFQNLEHEIETQMIDWRAIPENIGTFDCVLASDVLYEPAYAKLVSRAIKRFLAPDGRAYIADPGRVAASDFLDACEALGLQVTQRLERPYLAGKIRQKITVYELASRC
jgi:predicted nicotinamide N-methyase